MDRRRVTPGCLVPTKPSCPGNPLGQHAVPHQVARHRTERIHPARAHGSATHFWQWQSDRVQRRIDSSADCPAPLASSVPSRFHEAKKHAHKPILSNPLGAGPRRGQDRKPNQNPRGEPNLSDHATMAEGADPSRDRPARHSPPLEHSAATPKCSQNRPCWLPPTVPVDADRLPARPTETPQSLFAARNRFPIEQANFSDH